MINQFDEISQADGDILFVNTTIYPVSDTRGNVIGLHGISHYESKEYMLNFEFDTLLNTIPSGAMKYSADEGEQFEYINRNFMESLGYTQESLRGKFSNCFRYMIWHENRAQAKAEVIRWEGNGEIGKFDYRVEAADGTLW